MSYSVAFKRKPRILLVAGARPNFVKIAPLMKWLKPPERDAPAEVMLVHTGQHYDDAMSATFFDQLRIPKPDVNLQVGSGSHGRQTGEIMQRFEPVVSEWKPDSVVVVGDVNSTVACALVATKLGCRVAHVEAGLRSGDRAMPEEINRVMTDAIADYLFVSEPSGIDNLRREGVAESKLFLVGNVMIDSLLTFLAPARATTILSDLGLAERTAGHSKPVPFVLLTLHRPSNVDDPGVLRPLLEVLSEVGRDVPVLFPAHPRTLGKLQKFGLGGLVRPGTPTGPGVWILPPAGYLEFLHLMSEAALVLTDSGGIQEETTVLGVPCLTLRHNTERPITVDEGTNLLVGNDPIAILRETRSALSGGGKRGRVPPLWDGRAGKRVVDILLDQLRRDVSEIGDARVVQSEV
jgi:UDP-N-acetylglucosamine 2-epimerase (non-hydrolysing)